MLQKAPSKSSFNNYYYRWISLRITSLPNFPYDPNNRKFFFWSNSSFHLTKSNHRLIKNNFHYLIANFNLKHNTFLSKIRQFNPKPYTSYWLNQPFFDKTYSFNTQITHLINKHFSINWQPISNSKIWYYLRKLDFINENKNNHN